MKRNTNSTALSTDRRGVSEIIGAIFVFAILIMLLGIIQVWAVPAANEQTEFDHNQRAIADVQSLAADVHRVAGTGTGGSATVEIGARYDSRLFLVNPPAPAGSLRTEETTATIGNVRAVDGETRDYINGELTFDSRSLAYSPNYHEYRNAPVTHYEGWALYNEFASADIVQGGRSPVSGSRISLVALDGRQSTTAGGTVTVPTEPISAPMRTVTVESDGSGPITLTLDTGLGVDKWEEILSEELSTGEVQSVSQGSEDDPVVITLDEDRTYTLRLAKVGVGPGTTEEGAHYLTAPNPRPVIDETGGTVSVEVRDRFNNPVPGVEVSFDADDPIGLDATAVSNEDGVATARYDNPTVNRTTINASATVNADPTSSRFERGRVLFTDVPVTAAGQNDISDSEINPDTTESFKLISSVGVGKNQGQGRPTFDSVDVTFRNDGETTKEISQIRVNAYIRNAFDQKTPEIPASVTIDGSEHEIGGAYKSPTWTLSKRTVDEGDLATFNFKFQNQGGDDVELNNADFFVYSIQFKDGTTSRYFVQIQTA